MYKTEIEIFSQYSALKKTYQYFQENEEKVRTFFKNNSIKSVTFIGCGSGYSLCQSGEMSAMVHSTIPAYSLAAGDLMLNFPHYKNILKDTLLVAPSRSGSTSEVVIAVKKAKEAFSTPCISICAKADSELAGIADLSLEIPWSFDESVCQTRTVTNLYAANLLLIAMMSGKDSLIKEVGDAIASGEQLMDANKETLKEIGEDLSWDKVVVLADSELQGIASEAAIAFKEIPQIASNYYHILDVRHGPMVLIDEKTLVIMACSPFEVSYQQDLVKDLKGKGARVVSIGDQSANIWRSLCHVTVPTYENYGVAGIPFIFVPQIIAYYKAIARNINPDVPNGLDPWIKL